MVKPWIALAFTFWKLLIAPAASGKSIDMIDTGGTDFSTVFFSNNSKTLQLGVKSTRVSKKHHTESRDLESFVVEENFPKFSQLHRGSWTHGSLPEAKVLIGKTKDLIKDVFFKGKMDPEWRCPTVDGSDIRRTPVEVGSSSHDLQGLLHPKWCRISSINSIENGLQKLRTWGIVRWFPHFSHRQVS